MGNYSKFARCSVVVVKVFSLIMQKLLASIIEIDVLKVTDLKKRFSRNEKKTIQSLTTTDGFSKLNITLIYKLFKFLDLIPPPTQKWGAVPSKIDVEIGDDVERIMFARTDLLDRIDYDMDDSEFQTFFTDFINLGMRIDIHLQTRKDIGFQKDIENFKSCTINDCQEFDYLESITEQDLKEIDSNHLSTFLACYTSLPLARYQQNYAKRHNDISEILSDVHKNINQALVGSTAEGSDLLGSDTDTIWFSDSFKVFDGYEFQDLPVEGHPGHSKLHVNVSSKHSGLRDYTDVKDGKVYLNNRVKEIIIEHKAQLNFPINFSVHGPAYKTVLYDVNRESLFSNKKDEEVDFVLCIKRKMWPSHASEWKTRKRDFDWPTGKLVDRITSEGHYLAAVGSKESEDTEIQWRVSFNKAEQLLIESFNETHMQCFHLMKLLKKCLSNIAGKNITSYTMKTVLFWCLEETSNEHWETSNLLSCFCLCVSKLKSFVVKAFLPNYFIRERNLFIESEFTDEKRIKTIQYLQKFLLKQTAGICLLLPLYRKHANTQIYQLQITIHEGIFMRWLQTKIAMAYADPMKFGKYFLALYDGNDVENIFKRCSEVLDKLITVGYTQHLVKNLQNYMGVLQYILVRKENGTGEDGRNSKTREQYLKYMKLSISGDITHNTLRIATCYLDDGVKVKEDCLNIIRRVTCLDYNLFAQTFSERLRQTLSCDIEAFKKKQHTKEEIKIYNNILNIIELIEQDPKKAADVFEHFKERGRVLIGYDSLSLAWKQSYFDVTFMRAELPVLPKPAALELCIDKSQKHISFHPFLYGLLLEFIWHVKNGSENSEQDSVLGKMINCVLEFPGDQHSKRLNFITYCFLLQKNYCSAARYLLQAIKLNPVKQNVSYLYVKYILTLLRLASTSTLSYDKDDPCLWLNLLRIEWNID